MKKTLAITALLSLLFISWNAAKAFDGSECPIGCWVDTKGDCFCPEESTEGQKEAEDTQDNS